LTDRQPIVLLHGFWHGSWCWAEVVAHLSAAGRSTVAVDMAGHGLTARRPECARLIPPDAAALATERSPLADITLDMAADRLLEQVSLIGNGAAVTVVAHSMGGVVLTRAAQRHPDVIAHVVYVAAFMPASDRPVSHYYSVPECEGEQLGRLLRADPVQIGASRIAVASDVDRQRLRRVLYGDVDATTADAAMDLLSTDAPSNLVLERTTLTEQGWGSIRRTYVVCTADVAVPPPLQRLFIADADAAFPGKPTRVVELPASHSPFLSMPQRLAETITHATE
jgi:pimeloyl-ACP methyl ester carboxylesterase